MSSSKAPSQLAATICRPRAGSCCPSTSHVQEATARRAGLAIQRHPRSASASAASPPRPTPWLGCSPRNFSATFDDARSHISHHSRSFSSTISSAPRTRLGVAVGAAAGLVGLGTVVALSNQSQQRISDSDHGGENSGIVTALSNTVSRIANWLTAANQSLPSTQSAPAPPPPSTESLINSSESNPPMIADHGSIFARAHFALSLATRILALAFVFLPVLTALPLFVYLNSTLHTRMRRYLLPHSKELKDSSVPGKINALWFITLLSWSLQAAGPAFIKLAQYASSREDLFSYEVCKILSKLQDQGRPHSMFWTRRAFKKEHVEVVLSRSENISGIDSQEVNAATKSFEDVFEEFDETPVGVGAIAQVYKGRLKSNHKQVAIKVLHPYVVSLIQTDLIVLNLGAQALTAMFPKTLKWLSLPDEVAVFSTMMRAQTDLRTEASNLVQFSRNFEGWTVSSGGFGLVGFGKDAESVGDGKVLFPTPVLCSPSILVEEYIDAVPVSRFLTVRHHQELTSPRGSVAPSEGSDELVVVPLTEASRLLSAETGGSVFDVQVAKIGMQSFVKMLLVDNFCHADLHPGNILVSFLRTKGGSENSSDSNEAVDDEVARCLPYGVNRLSDLSKVDDDAFLETMATLKKEGFVPAIVYLDAGLVSTLSPQNLVNLNDLLVKIVQFDGPGVARLLVERQRLRDDGGVIDFEGFSGKMAVLLNRIRDSSLKLSTVSFSWILRQVFGMVRSHHVRLEGDFANVGVAVMLVEGVGRRLDPGVDLLEEVRNIVANEWALAVGDVWLIRGVLEIYATAKRIGQELVNGQWLST